MVSSLRADALQDPSKVIQDLFSAFSGSLDAFPRTVSDHFRGLFGDQWDEKFQGIPSLEDEGKTDLRPLVKFRGMVQDTSPGKELYLGQYADGSCGGWGIPHEQDSGIDYAKLRDSTVVWATSVPGESPWVQPMKKSQDPLRLRVRLYGKSAEDLKPTEVMTFVGILSAESDMDCIYYEAHRSYVSPSAADLDGVADLREELIDWIATEALAGDRNVAEWILLSVLGRVESRQRSLLPPSLTICGFPAHGQRQTLPTLPYVLSQVLPSIPTIPLTLQTLNESIWVPESSISAVDTDEPSETLLPGLLQLPASSLLLIETGQLEPGTVAEKGLHNLAHIQNMVSTQTIPYVFPYSNFDFDTQINCIVLTEGRDAGLVKTTLTVPLHPKTDGLEEELARLALDGTNNALYREGASVILPVADRLDKFRRYLCRALECPRATIGKETAEFIHDDFVNERKSTLGSSEGVVTGDDLLTWMTLAKTLAASLHQPEVTRDIWSRAKEMEKERRRQMAILQHSAR